eukprot:4377441-Prymnesium_polylepis.1
MRRRSSRTRRATPRWGAAGGTGSTHVPGRRAPVTRSRLTGERGVWAPGADGHGSRPPAPPLTPTALLTNNIGGRGGYCPPLIRHPL